MIIVADIPNPANAIADGIGSVIGWGAGKAADTFLAPIGEAIAKGLATAAAKVSEEVLHFIASSATVDFTSGWWAGDRGQTIVRQVGTLSAVLLLGFLLLALVQGLLAGDVGAMLRSALLEVPVSVFATVVLVAVTTLLLGLTDGASSMVLSGTPEALGHFFKGFGVLAIKTNGFLAIVMVVVFLVGALLVWIELVVRSSLIYLLVAAAPLTAAARVWPAARGLFRRVCELGVALVVSKFVIALTLGLGAAALAGGGPRPDGADVGTQAGMSLGAMLTGASLMLLAAFTPFVILRLIPIVEAAVIAQGISRSPVRAAQAGMQGAYYASGLRRLSGGGASPGRALPSGGAGPTGGGGGPGAGPAPSSGAPSPPGGGPAGGRGTGSSSAGSASSSGSSSNASTHGGAAAPGGQAGSAAPESSGAGAMPLAGVAAAGVRQAGGRARSAATHTADPDLAGARS